MDLVSEGEALLAAARDTRPGRPTAALFPFPAERVIRDRRPGYRGDQVAITHRGETVVYDTPEDLHEAVRRIDPHALAARRQADDHLAAARALRDEAALTLQLARAHKAHAERRLRPILTGTIVAAILAAMCLLGAL